MASIGPTGANTGSGLDVNGLVNKLVTAERMPMDTRLTRQESQIQADISALGSFRGTLADFQSTLKELRNTNDLRKVSATSSNKDALEVSANSDAQSGNYKIEIKQLAQAQRLTSTVFESDLDVLGNGKLTFQFGRVNPRTGQFELGKDGQVQTLEITDSNNSLRGVSESINRANLGAHASIINDGNGYRLVLSADHPGEENQMRILVNQDTTEVNAADGLAKLSFDVTNPLNQSRGMVESTAAKNAEIVIDGIEVTSASNQIDNAIPGVMLKLKDLMAGEPLHVTVEFNQTATKDAIQKFIKSFNEMNAMVQSIAGVDPKTKQAGPLSGDSTIRGIIDQIHRALTGSYGGINHQYVSLASIGINSQRDGTLTLDEAKLDKAIDDNFTEVAQLFAKAGSTSDSLVKFIGAKDSTQMGAYALRVAQMPTHGYYIGQETVGLDSQDISDEHNTFSLKLDGVTSGTIALTPGHYATGQDLAAELTRQINADKALKQAGASVKVRAVADQLVLESSRQGGQSRVEIVSSESAIRDIGLDPAVGIDGQDIQGTLGNEPATGSGNRLTGRNAATGLQVDVLGGKTGNRGEVVFSRGIAEQLYGILDGYLANEGIIAARNKGYDNRINDIGKQREQLDRRMAVSEQRLLKQYSSLDALLGKMRDTSAFLSSHLPKSNSLTDLGSNDK